MINETPMELVMLVDDNDIDNFIAQRIIEVTGYAKKVVTMTSGSSALEYLSFHESDFQNLPELIFLDLDMPKADGFKFLEDFEKLDQAITSKCKVIILSSFNDKHDNDRILKNDHVIKFITKPLSEDVLTEIRLKTA